VIPIALRAGAPEPDGPGGGGHPAPGMARAFRLRG
jgi:hypothetical protein